MAAARWAAPSTSSSAGIFSAKELTTYVGTSTDGGATEYRVSYLDGRTFDLFGRKTNLTLLLDYRHRDPLYQRDRNYLQRALDKYGPNTALRNAAGVSPFEQFTIPVFAGPQATILVNNAPTAAVNDLGIPARPACAGSRFPSARPWPRAPRLRLAPSPPRRASLPPADGSRTRRSTTRG